MAQPLQQLRQTTLKRRDSIRITALALISAGCRQESHPPPAAWTDLTGQWEHVTGGSVDESDTLRLGWGETLTAVKWTGAIPEPPFELELEARLLDGTDFFCAITFPVRDDGTCVTLVIGGWGGATVGISSIDDQDARENETTTYRKFVTDTWYRIRIVRNRERIETWIDDEKVIDLDTTGKRLSLRPGPIEVCAPFGLATWQSSGEIRNARWRSLTQSP